MRKKITLEETLPGGLGDCVTVLADGEPVVAVRPVDDEVWLWTPLYSDEQPREVHTSELAGLVQKLREGPAAQQSVNYIVHECTDGVTFGPDGEIVNYNHHWSHAGTCGNWTIRGPYETEEKAMHWRGARHVIILREEGGKQCMLAEFIGGSESARSRRARADARVSAELGIPAVDYTDDWKQVVVRLPPGESGSTRYVTWERDADVVKYYTPEGQLLAKWAAPARATYTDCLALVLKNTEHETPAGFTAQFQTRIYGSED